MPQETLRYRTLALLTCATVLIGTLELAARTADNLFFPPPSAILAGVHAEWFSGPVGDLFLTDGFQRHAMVSVQRLLTGFAIAVVIGTVFGLLVGTSPRTRDALLPAMRFAGGIPPPALLPIALVLFGIGDLRQVSIIAVGSVWPVLLGAMTGSASVDPLASDAARVLRLSRTNYLIKVLWPAAFPQLANGIRIAFGFSVVLMVISEMFVASSGLGFRLVEAQRTFQITPMWATVVLIALLGVLFSVALEMLLRRPLRWHYAKEGR